MLFSFSIGSEGQGKDSFSINFPLVLSPGKKLNFEETCSFNIGDDLKLTFEKHKHLYTLKVSAFSTVESAKKYIETLIASLRWVSLKNKLGIRFPSEIHDPKMAKEPIVVNEKTNFYEIVSKKGWAEIDGNYDLDKLTIIPEHKKLMRWESGNPSITLGLNPQRIVDDINESISFSKTISIQSDKKLCLAIELYSAHQFEVSNTAKFIKLVTVIEALLPNLDIPDEILLLLEKAKKVIKEERRAAKKCNQDTELIDHFMSRLGGLKRQSIGVTMALYLSQCLDDFPELGDKDTILPKMKELYNIRSSLLHDREFDESVLKSGIETLSEIVPNLLTRLYIQCSS